MCSVCFRPEAAGLPAAAGPGQPDLPLSPGGQLSAGSLSWYPVYWTDCAVSTVPAVCPACAGALLVAPAFLPLLLPRAAAPGEPQQGPGILPLLGHPARTRHHQVLPRPAQVPSIHNHSPIQSRQQGLSVNSYFEFVRNLQKFVLISKLCRPTKQHAYVLSNIFQLCKLIIVNTIRQLLAFSNIN